MSTRWQIERAVLTSDLSPRARHIALTLLTLADPKNAVVPAEFTPSLSRLVEMTGYVRSTVAKELNALEAAGWVMRKRPSVAAARAEKERTKYRLAVPKGSPHHGLESPDDHILSSPHHGLASPHHGPELVRTTDSGLVRTTDSDQTKNQTNNQTAERGPERIVTEATDATAEEAAAIVKRIRNERNPRSLPGLLRVMARDGDLAQHLTEIRAAVRLREVEALWTAIKRGPECEHRMPGGAMPHPSTGEAVCLSCRKAARIAKTESRNAAHKEAN